MSATLETALNLAKDGYRVFPLEPSSKFPVIAGWPKRATTDRATIEKWWHCPIMDWAQAWGVGVATGQGLVVVDIDVKKEDGAGALAMLEDLNDALPKEMTVRTPSGGYHFYLRCAAPVANSTSKIAPGIDIRGDGGFVVGPGTEINGKRYEVLR